MTAIILPFLFASYDPSPSGGGSSRSASIAEHSAWLDRVRDGDVVAFDNIVLTFDDPLRRFVARTTGESDATDVVQDVFIWLWEHRATIPSNVHLRPYLYAAARNRALRLVRHAQVEARSEAEFHADVHVPGMAAPNRAPDVIVEDAELARAVERALNTLSPRVHQVALLRWQDGLRRDEIADILGVSVATVKNQLATAIRVLRPLVQAFGGEPPRTAGPDRKGGEAE